MQWPACAARRSGRKTRGRGAASTRSAAADRLEPVRERAEARGRGRTRSRASRLRYGRMSGTGPPLSGGRRSRRRRAHRACRTDLRAVLQRGPWHRARPVPRPRARAEQRRDAPVRAPRRRRQRIQAGVRRSAPMGGAMKQARSAETHRCSGQPVVLVVDDEPDLLELVSLTLESHESQDTHRPRSQQRTQAAQERALRSLPDRHAPARWRRARSGRLDPGKPRLGARGGDHGARQRRIRGARAEARRVRFRVEAARPRRAAQARGQRHQARAPASARRHDGHIDGAAAARQLGGHGAAARDDRPRRAQPGSGAHLRRVRHRQGAGRAHDPRERRRGATGPSSP